MESSTWDDALDLLLDLVGPHEDVRVVLGEAPDPEQSVQGSGLLVPVDQSELPHPDGQVPVGPGLGLVHQHASGAVHRLDAEDLVVDRGGVHVVLVVVPVPGAEPERLVEDDGGGDLVVVLPDVELPPVVDEGVLQDHPLGEEEREPGALLHDGEQAELLPELAVVPLLRLLQHVEVGLELLLALERGTVDPGEHLVVLVPPPVRAGEGQELERLDGLGVEGVGSRAEVRELALLVEADGRVLGEVLHKLDLVVLALGLQELDGLGPGKGVGLQLQVLLDDLLHLGLDLLEVLGGEPSLLVEVVVEAIVDGGPDGQLGAGPEPLDRLRHDVGGGVPDDRELVIRLAHRSVSIECLHCNHLVYGPRSRMRPGPAVLPCMPPPSYIWRARGPGDGPCAWRNQTPMHGNGRRPGPDARMCAAGRSAGTKRTFI